MYPSDYGYAENKEPIILNKSKYENNNWLYHGNNMCAK